MPDEPRTPATTESLSTPVAPGIANELIAPSASLADRLQRGTLLVAVTGTSDSNGAVSVAHALEGRYQATVQAVQVLDTSAGPMPAPLPSMFTIARDLIGDAPYAADVLSRQREFAALLGQPNEWPVRISLGTPAEEIL